MIFSGKLKTELKSGIIEEMFTQNQEILKERNQEIRELQTKLTGMFGDSLPDYVLRKEVYVNYPEIESNYFAKIEHKLKDGKSDTHSNSICSLERGYKKEGDSTSEGETWCLVGCTVLEQTRLK